MAVPVDANNDELEESAASAALERIEHAQRTATPEVGVKDKL